MAIWQMVLYVAAAFLAVRSLVSLMSRGRKVRVRRFLKRGKARMRIPSGAPNTAESHAPRFKRKQSRSAA